MGIGVTSMTRENSLREMVNCQGVIALARSDAAI
jgi:hypothetical protein